MEKREEIREAVLALGEQGRGMVFPKQLREQILSYAEPRIEAGQKLKQVAEEIGIKWYTLGRWRSEQRQRGFRRVQLDVEPSRKVTVFGPCNVRVEGLDLAAVAELIRRLG
jgi:hypothetical protein